MTVNRKREQQLLKSTEGAILVTGGAGFIGSNFVLEWLEEERGPLVNLDALTYAGNLENLASLGAIRPIPSCGEISAMGSWYRA